MPEVLEVEQYRKVASAALGRRIGIVEAPDAWYLKGGIGAGVLGDLLVGAVITAARRRGKLLMLDTDREVVVGLRFGLTGALRFRDPPAEGGGWRTRDEVGQLLYAPRGEREEWERFGLRFTDGARMVLSDPRRLGGVYLDPSTDRLGPEAAGIGPEELAGVLDSDAPLKAVLLDQSRVAGLGNLLVDETLWRAGLGPLRPARTLDPAGREHLAATIRATVAELGERGGSHKGDLQEERHRGGECPRCGAPLRRDEVGGRTTWWCPRDQR